MHKQNRNTSDNNIVKFQHHKINLWQYIYRLKFTYTYKIEFVLI